MKWDCMTQTVLEDVVEIAKWMKSPVRTVKPLDSIEHARDVMAEHRINQLPVVAGGRLVGIVSDRDLRDAYPSVFADPTRREGADPKQIQVQEVMTSNVLTLAPADSMIAAASLMRRERVGAVPIVDGSRLVGILARSDVLDALVGLDAIIEGVKSTVKP
jgi:acetoin utilization protein AcuB